MLMKLQRLLLQPRIGSGKCMTIYVKIIKY
jgi:hypothetical protein